MSKGIGMDAALTAEAVETYRRTGALHPLEGLSPGQAEFYRAALVASCGEGERPASAAGLRQPQTRVKPYLLFPWAAALIREPAILDAVAAVIGEDIMVFHTTIWWKPAGSEGRVPWHQDATYFGLEPHEHVTAWVALTDSLLESGCVRVLPGSHRLGQRPHADRKDPAILLSRGQSVMDPIDEALAVPVELRAGQFSLHDTLALHASAPNRSARDRIGVGISYIPTRVRHVGQTRLSATLVRGVDRYGHFDHEPRPVAALDDAAVAAHADSLARFWAASESIPEMALIH